MSTRAVVERWLSLFNAGDAEGIAELYTEDAVNHQVALPPVEGRAICVPTHRGKRGNPVLFAAAFFETMADASGDTGAKHLIGEHEDQVVEIEMETDAVLADIDDPAALAALQRPTVSS